MALGQSTITRIPLEKLTDTTASHLPHDLTSDSLPFWLVNVPQSQWTKECPSFLLGQSPKNIKCLSTPDDQYTRQNWTEVKEIIRTNRIDLFQRVPSELRRYLEFMAHIRAEYSSVMRFVIQERLHWGDGKTSDLQPRGKPFEHEGKFDLLFLSFSDFKLNFDPKRLNPGKVDPKPGTEDIRILYNDWPYGVSKDIIHLVVWTKFPLEDDPMTDDLTQSARDGIEGYVRRKFWRVPAEQVIWFRNWKSLKSVHAIEHFHVMLWRPDMEFVQEITRGDVPLIERV